MRGLKKLVMIACAAAFAAAFASDRPKKVILFIGDGMSTPQRMIAEEFSRKAGRGPLAMNSLPHQAVTRTCSANSLVTDSAAAATAIACGVKTCNHSVGVDPQGQPVYSCAKKAHDDGMKVGLVTTVTITHATPAGFYAHRPNRGETLAIARDLADSGFDLFAGGGLDTKEEGWKYAEEKGYRLVTTVDEFKALKPGCGKVLTRFRNGALPNSLDMAGEKNVPTLAGMTAKALELLDCEEGFFLMVEGGRIDWAGHANDAAANMSDVLALDEAVKVALDFRKRNAEDTLVVVTGDHETGGMSMGFSDTGYALYMERLANQTMSVEKFTAEFAARKKAGGFTFDKAKPLVEKAFGFKFSGDPKSDPMVLAKSELESLKKAFDGDFAGACRLIISHKSGIGWSSGHHTAMPVMTTAEGCGAEMFTGFIENTEIAEKLKSVL